MRNCCKRTVKEIIKAYNSSFYTEMHFDFEGFNNRLKEMAKGETHKAGKTRTVKEIPKKKE